MLPLKYNAQRPKTVPTGMGVPLSPTLRKGPKEKSVAKSYLFKANPISKAKIVSKKKHGGTVLESVIQIRKQRAKFLNPSETKL
jgi:hypothetical protein